MPDGAKVQAAAAESLGPRECYASSLWTLQRLRFGPVDGPDLQFRYGDQGTPRASDTTWTGASVA